MTTLKTRQIVQSLSSKGFREVDGNHRRLVYYFGGRKTEVRTKVSHGSKEVSDGLIHAMAQQTRLSKSDFVELITCTLDADGYAEKLRAAGIDLDPAV